MWKQVLIGVLVVGCYVGHDLWKRSASPLKGLNQGAQFVDNQGTRYTCNISLRNGGGYVIELLPSDAGTARGGM
ncbi:MAG: hypothetical protein WBD40_21155 [Tepidisphaeraceae bacterium]